MDLDAAYALNRPLVVSDTIEDETVILHHGTGRYFDTAGTGTFIWRELCAGRSPAAIAEAIAAGAGIGSAAALEAVRNFLASLAANDLIAPCAQDRPALLAPATGPISFSAPSLGVHTDLADMLLLDPIHDVGPSGWPQRPEAAPTATAVDAR